MSQCEGVAGFFYLQGAVGGNASCANVRAKCSNAQAGEEYVVPNKNQVVVQSTGCPVRKCDGAPPVGRYYARGGSCMDSALDHCTVAGIGEYYVPSPNDKPCQFLPCMNAKAGQFYTAGLVSVFVVCLFVRERERERECVCICVCLCVCVFVCVCLCFPSCGSLGT